MSFSPSRLLEPQKPCRQIPHTLRGVYPEFIEGLRVTKPVYQSFVI
jgi:hypothetical protein